MSTAKYDEGVKKHRVRSSDGPKQYRKTSFLRVLNNPCHYLMAYQNYHKSPKNNKAKNTQMECRKTRKTEK